MPEHQMRQEAEAFASQLAKIEAEMEEARRAGMLTDMLTDEQLPVHAAKIDRMKVVCSSI